MDTKRYSLILRRWAWLLALIVLGAALLAWAVTGRTPAVTDRALLVVGVALGALLWGAAGVFGIELLVDNVKTEDDVKKATNAPLLALLQQADHTASAATGSRSERPAAVTAEAYREASRTFVPRGKGPQRQGRTVLICAANPTPFSSRVAMNFASAAAMAGTPTLLVDANQADGGVTRTLQLQEEPGFSDALADPTSEILLQLVPSAPDLYVLPLGLRRVPENILFSSVHLRSVIERSGAQGSLVVISGPAVGAEPNGLGLAIARAADEVILLAVADDTRRRALRRAAGLLKGVGTNLAGVVFMQRGALKREVAQAAPAPTPPTGGMASAASRKKGPSGQKQQSRPQKQQPKAGKAGRGREAAFASEISRRYAATVKGDQAKRAPRPAQGAAPTPSPEPKGPAWGAPAPGTALRRLNPLFARESLPAELDLSGLDTLGGAPLVRRLPQEDSLDLSGLDTLGGQLSSIDPSTQAEAETGWPEALRVEPNTGSGIAPEVETGPLREPEAETGPLRGPEDEPAIVPPIEGRDAAFGATGESSRAAHAIPDWVIQGEAPEPATPTRPAPAQPPLPADIDFGFDVEGVPTSTITPEAVARAALAAQSRPDAAEPTPGAAIIVSPTQYAGGPAALPSHPRDPGFVSHLFGAAGRLAAMLVTLVRRPYERGRPATARSVGSRRESVPTALGRGMQLGVARVVRHVAIRSAVQRRLQAERRAEVSVQAPSASAHAAPMAAAYIDGAGLTDEQLLGVWLQRAERARRRGDRREAKALIDLVLDRDPRNQAAWQLRLRLADGEPSTFAAAPATERIPLRILGWLIGLLALALVAVVVVLAWPQISERFRALIPSEPTVVPAPAGVASVPAVAPTSTPAMSKLFAETGYTVESPIIEFWTAKGGLAIFGLPISARLREVDDEGRSVDVQYFERSRLEVRTGDAGTGQQVVIGRLGTEVSTKGKLAGPLPTSLAGEQIAFSAAGFRVPRKFYDFWAAHDGQVLFGDPLSALLQEALPGGGTLYVQYFESARLEYNPANDGRPYEIQLGRLGVQVYKQRYGGR